MGTRESKIIKLDNSKYLHYSELGYEDLSLLDGPVVLCLGGNATTKEWVAKGVCRLVESALGLQYAENKDKDLKSVNLIGVVYGSNGREKDFPTGCMSEEEVDKFVDRLFITRCFDEKGSRRTLEECCRRVGQITFFSHCNGASEELRLMQGFQKRLQEAGFEENEIKEVFASTMHISYAPITNYDLVPSIRIKSLGDKLLNYEFGSMGEIERYYMDAYEERLKGVVLKYDEANKYLDCEDLDNINPQGRITVYSERLLNESGKDIDEHPASLLMRNDLWKLRGIKKDDGDYENIEDKNADIVSQIMSCALAFSVLNGIQNCNSVTYVPKMSLKDQLGEMDYLMNKYTPSELMVKE